MLDAKLYRLANRTLIEVKGTDAFKFLQNLITNDIKNVKHNLVYSALLTPQGKYLYDFFIIKKSDTLFIIDIVTQMKNEFLRRLNIYKLRSDVNVQEVQGYVGIGTSDKPSDAFFDPRCEKLGWRLYFFESNYPISLPVLDGTHYDKLRVDYGIPETGIELIKDKTFILEVGFDRLSGVSFTKGCYIGQEVTARMRHKTELQKGLVKVKILGETSRLADTILFEDKVVGTLYTRVEDYAIAYLRFKYENFPLTVGNAQVVPLEKY